MKKSITILLSLMMILLLSACGSKEEAEDDPNLGVYVAKTGELSGIEIAVEDVFDGGFEIELKKKGKGEARVGGEDASIKWTLDGDDFHAKGGGVELDGTLKDGVMILDDVIGSGVTLKLECEEAMQAMQSSDSGDDMALSGDASGQESSEGSGKNRFDSVLKDGKQEVGKWTLYTVTENGNVYMQNDLRAKGIDSWIQIDPNGKGRIFLVGNIMDMEWDNGVIVVPENQDGERDEYRYSMLDDFLVLVDGDMTLAFEREGKSTSSASDATETAQISMDLISKFEGDWHGVLYFTDAKGDTFATRNVSKCDVAARFAMDDAGNVTPYFAEAKDDDPAANFQNITAYLDPSSENMYVSGKLLGGNFEGAEVTAQNGLLHMAFTVSADNGDTINVELAMRHPDDPWQDGDYPMYPKEGFEYYKGKSLEQVLKDFGNMPSGLPEKTNLTGWE